jgi:hypothetical protein
LNLAAFPEYHPIENTVPLRATKVRLLEHREQLKQTINDAQRELGEQMRAEQTIEEIQPHLKRISTLHDQLARTYCSWPRWWLRQIKNRVWGLYYRFRPVGLQTVTPGPFESTNLVHSMGPQIAASDADPIRITAENIAAWLGPETTSLPGFDPVGCMNVLRKGTRPGFIRCAGIHGSFFMDCPTGEFIQISGIVRAPREPHVGHA